jgi:hypothetical protein
MTHQRARGTGLQTVAAFRATLKKQRLVDRTGRPKPIGAWNGGRRLGSGLDVFGKLLRRLRDGED